LSAIFVNDLLQNHVAVARYSGTRVGNVQGHNRLSQHLSQIWKRHPPTAQTQLHAQAASGIDVGPSFSLSIRKANAERCSRRKRLVHLKLAPEAAQAQGVVTGTARQNGALAVVHARLQLDGSVSAVHNMLFLA
jgi:hypothetical protein